MYLKYLMHAKRRRIKGDVVISNMHSCLDFITSFSINQVFSSRTRLLPLFSCFFEAVNLPFFQSLASRFPRGAFPAFHILPQSASSSRLKCVFQPFQCLLFDS